MTAQPLISVIVPVYNAEKYLGRCIESILAQTYSTLEVILIDDGSVDRSGEICDWYAMQDNRVRVIHKANGGVSAARNDGIEAAVGEYIAFCDNDDFYASGMLRRLLDMCRENDCGIAQCLCEKGVDEYLPTPPQLPVKVLSNRRMLENFYTEATIYIWDKLYRRNVFSGVRFPVGSYEGEDRTVVHHLLWVAERVAITREKLYYHYRNPDSVMNRGFDVRWANGALADRLAFAHKEGLPRLAADTLVKMVYEQGYLLVMNRHYNKEIHSQREFAESHTALFYRYYRQAMHTAGVKTKDKLFMSLRRYTPCVYNLYNYLKWRIVRGDHTHRWGEIK
jgi:glycosyltransferase involved in cell wall biosynthesis